MPYLDREEYLNAIKNKVGEDESDEALEFIANMTDTYDELINRNKGYDELETKFNNLKKEYKERFFSGGGNDTIIETEEESESDNEDEKILTYENLFKSE